MDGTWPSYHFRETTFCKYRLITELEGTAELSISVDMDQVSEAYLITDSS